MPSSGIIDLAIGLAFVFGVTAALSSVVTELIARYLGLRGAYLLRGLRELLDNDEASMNLADARGDYDAVQGLIAGHRARTGAKPAAKRQEQKHAALAAENERAGLAAEQTPGERAQESDHDAAAGGTPGPEPSATSTLLGGPILRSQGMIGEISSRKLRMQPAKKPRRAKPASGAGRPADLAGATGSLAEPADAAGRQAEQAAPGGRWRRLAAAPERWGHQRRLPSYIPARSFAEAVIDLVAPDSAGGTTMNTVQQSVDALPESMSVFKPSLQALVNNADGDIRRFRASIEHWYDDHMDRVSGWYKRRVAKITLLVGAVLVLLLNVNALTIGRTLYTDSSVRAAVSSVAAKSTSCPAATAPAAAGRAEDTCLADIQARLAAAAQAGLPIGWGTVRDCTLPNAACGWLDQRGILSRHGDSGWQLALVLIGFLITIAALVPGARFWFGLLAKLGSMRATGPKPATPAS